MSDNFDPMTDIDKVRELVRRGYDILEIHGVVGVNGILYYSVPSMFRFYLNRYGLTIVFRRKYLYSCQSNEISIEHLNYYDNALKALRKLMVLDDVVNA